MRTKYFVYEDTGAEMLVFSRKFVTRQGALRFAETEARQGLSMVVVEVTEEIIKEFSGESLEVAA